VDPLEVEARAAARANDPVEGTVTVTGQDGQPHEVRSFTTIVTPRSSRARGLVYTYRLDGSLLKDLVEGPGGGIGKADVAATAARWGFLRIGERSDDSEAPSESLDFWVSELIALRFAWELSRTGGNLRAFALRFFANVLVDDPGGPSVIKDRDKLGRYWIPGEAEGVLDLDHRAESAHLLMEEVLAKRLNGGEVEILLKAGRYALRPKTLLAAAWLELADRVLRTPPERTCRYCKKSFIPATRRRVYCPPPATCKDDDKNARRATKAKRKTRKRRSR
jgi:hypothetical protein